MASRSQQPGRLQRLARDQHPRPAAKLPDSRSGSFTTDAAMRNTLPRPSTESPTCSPSRSSRSSPPQPCPARAPSFSPIRRRQLHLAVKRIQRRIDCLQTHQHRVQRLRRTTPSTASPSPSSFPRRSRSISSSPFCCTRSRLLKHPRRKVRRHDRPRPQSSSVARETKTRSPRTPVSAATPIATESITNKNLPRDDRISRAAIFVPPNPSLIASPVRHRAVSTLLIPWHPERSTA